MRILVAGIGNIFFGDDGFGVEVLRALSEKTLEPEVTIRDFGIRGYDLACALTDGYDAAILVDAVARGEPPGTVFAIQPDPPSGDESEMASLDPHSLHPLRVLQAARSFGELPQELYLVGCEPGETFEPEGRIGLSDPVRQAVPNAVRLIEWILNRSLNPEAKLGAGLVAGVERRY